MLAVELVLDDALDSEVRRLWRLLLDAGLDSQAKHRGDTNRPHLTVAACDAVDPDLAVATPIPIRLTGIGVFGHSRTSVLYAAVELSAELAALHAETRTRVVLADERPWTPHVTLAHRLKNADLPRALALLADWPGAAGQAPAARLWDTETRTVTALPASTRTPPGPPPGRR